MSPNQQRRRAPISSNFTAYPTPSNPPTQVGASTSLAQASRPPRAITQRGNDSPATLDGSATQLPSGGNHLANRPSAQRPVEGAGTAPAPPAPAEGEQSPLYTAPVGRNTRISVKQKKNALPRGNKPNEDKYRDGLKDQRDKFHQAINNLPGDVSNRPSGSKEKTCSQAEYLAIATDVLQKVPKWWSELQFLRKLHSGSSAVTEPSQSQSHMEVEDDTSNYMSTDGDMIGSPGTNMQQDPLEPFSQNQYEITNDYPYPGWAADNQSDYPFFRIPYPPTSTGM